MFSIKGNKTIFFILLFCTGNFLFAQTNKADKYYGLKEYSKAIPLYIKYLQKNTSTEVIIKLADCYYQTKNYQEAEKYYEILISKPPVETEIALRYSEVLKNNSKYKKAKDVVLVYSLGTKEHSNKFEVHYNEINQWNNEPPKAEVKPVKGINTQYSEFAPTPYRQGIVFVSDQKKDLVDETTFGWTNTPYLSVFYTEFLSDSLHFSKPKMMDPAINDEYHNGPIVFDSAQTLAYFNRVQNLKKGAQFENKPQLFGIYQKNDKWQNAIPFMYNSEEYALAHPALSKDGNTLIFTSDMPGGYGGKDLYICYKHSAGWSSPQNMGEIINTPGDEMFPNLTHENTLYFSSTGHNGLGGMDVFFSKQWKDQWTKPQNVKKPINSSFDDFGICFIDSTQGYFSSNRKGGQGADDIYYFKLTEIHTQKIQITGYFMYDELTYASQQKLQLLNEENEVIAFTVTDEKGNFTFKELEPEKKYYIVPENVNAINASSKIYITNNENKVMLTLTPNQQGYFVFETLPIFHETDLPLLAVEDVTLNIPKLFGRAFEILPGDLPPGLEILALDDDGNILSIATTDASGNFSFDYLPPDKKYTLRIKNQTDNSKIEILNEFFEPIAKITGNQKTGFNYEILAKDMANITLLEGSDILQNFTTSISGYLQIPNLSIENTQLYLLDENNVETSIQFSSNDGYFELNNLSPYKNYRLKVEGSNSFIPLSEVIITNSKKQKIQVLNKETKSVFSFFTLSVDEYEMLPVLSENNTLPGLYGKAFYKLPGDISEKLEVLLLDDQGNIIETTTIDAFGNYHFKTLPGDKNYIIKLNNQDEHITLVVLDEAGNKTYVRKNEQGVFVYNTLNKHTALPLDLLSELTTVKLWFENKSKHTNPYYFILTDPETQKERIYKPSNEQIISIDSISPYKNYMLTLVTNDSAILFGFNNLYVLNSEGQKCFKLAKNNHSTFAFYPLNYYEYDLMPDITLSDQQLFGKLFKKLPGDISTALKVYLLDDSGAIIDSTHLDRFGNFEFSKLPKNKNYLVKLANEDVFVQMMMVEDGTFKSIKPDPLSHGFDFSTKKYKSFSGRVFERLPGDLPEALKIYVINDAGQLVDSAYTDRFGNFLFNKLPLDGSYKLHVKYNEDVKLIFVELSETGKYIQLDPSKYIHLSPLENMPDWLSGIQTDNPQADLEADFEDETSTKLRYFGTIFYDFNKSEFKTTDIDLLQELKNYLIQHTNQKLKIISHTDQKGNEKYNLILSQYRAQYIKTYLEKEGISSDRILTEAYGEYKPTFANVMPNGDDFSSGRDKNRRSELFIVK